MVRKRAIAIPAPPGTLQLDIDRPPGDHGTEAPADLDIFHQRLRGVATHRSEQFAAHEQPLVAGGDAA